MFLRLILLFVPVLFVPAASAAEKVSLPDATYIAYMNDGKCATFVVKDGKPVSFAVATSCKPEDLAKPEFTVDKVRVKGNTYTFGAAKYVVENHDNGLVKGEWQFQGTKNPVAFLKQ